MRPRIAAALAGLAAIVPACGRAPAPAGPPDLAPRPLDLVVLNVELLRADHVGRISGRTDLTPNLDRFFANGIVFADASAPAGATYLSATAIATGTEAALNDHRLTRLGLGIQEAIEADGKRVVDHLPTIAQTLRANGYRTIALNEWQHTGHEVFLDRGFDEFVQIGTTNRAVDPSPEGAVLFAEQVDELLALLERCGPGRFYLHFHPNSLHYPFRLPVERARRDPALFAELEALADVHERFVGLHPWRLRERLGVPRFVAGEAARADPREQRIRAVTRRMYEEQVRYVDEELGRFLDALERSGRLERTLVVLYANHGLGLFDNDVVIMGVPYQSCVHVPLLMRHPGVRVPVRVDTPVSLVDLAATLYELLGTAPQVALPAHSLADPARGRPYGREFLFGRDIQTEYVRHGDWKLVVSTASARELYDLRRDPGETTSLHDPQLDMARTLEAELRRHKLEQHRLRAELAQRPATTAPPDVVLLDLDLLRADAVGLLTGNGATPNLDAFFAGGAQFAQAQSPSGYTWLANAAVLTGRDALEIPWMTPRPGATPSARDSLAQDGVRRLAAFPSLAERFAAAGYATANVNQGEYSGRHAGLDRGFGTYRELPGDATAVEGVAALQDILARAPESPHLVLFRPDVLHYPYLRPAEGEPAPSRPGFVFDDPAGPGLRRITFAAPLTRLTRTLAGPLPGDGPDPAVYRVRLPADGSERVLTRGDLRAIRAAYEQQVRHLDASLAPALDTLASRSRPTVVVLYANHGESLGDHGNFAHATAYQECVRVPLLVRLPTSAPARRVDDPVSLIDLVPTLCDLAGIAIDDDLPGRSLVPLLSGGPLPARPLFGTNDDDAYIRDGRFKVIVAKPGTRQLFDLEHDPDELHDLAASRPALAHRLAAALVRHDLQLRSKRPRRERRGRRRAPQKGSTRPNTARVSSVSRPTSTDAATCRNPTLPK